MLSILQTEFPTAKYISGTMLHRTHQHLKENFIFIRGNDNKLEILTKLLAAAPVPAPSATATGPLFGAHSALRQLKIQRRTEISESSDVISEPESMHLSDAVSVRGDLEADSVAASWNQRHRTSSSGVPSVSAAGSALVASKSDRLMRESQIASGQIAEEADDHGYSEDDEKSEGDEYDIDDPFDMESAEESEKERTASAAAAAAVAAQAPPNARFAFNSVNSLMREPTMVFCNTVPSCRAVEHYLAEQGFRTVPYHGGVPPKVTCGLCRCRALIELTLLALLRL